MKRLFIGVILALAVTSASPALADPPPTNKNTSVFSFSCTGGTAPATFQAVGIAQSAQIAGQLLDGTATVHFVQLIDNGQLVFVVPGQLDRPDLSSCTIAEASGLTALVFLTPRG